MTSDLDIYRAASLLVIMLGQDAPSHVTTRADESLEAGDLHGHAVFKRILMAVQELQHAQPAPGARVH
jgi:hypothetical protein